MQNLALLTVFRDTAVCDRCGYEAELLTDGQRCIASDQADTALIDFCRTGSKITSNCLHSWEGTIHGDGECDGRFTWDIGSGTWRAASNIDAEALGTFGSVVER